MRYNNEDRECARCGLRVILVVADDDTRVDVHSITDSYLYGSGWHIIASEDVCPACIEVRLKAATKEYNE